MPSAAKPAPIASWGKPYDQLTEEEKTRAWFTDGSAHKFRHQPEEDSCSITTPFWDNPESQWAELQTIHMAILLFGRSNGQMCSFSLIYGLQPTDWLDSQGFRKNMIRKLVRRVSGEEVCE